MGGEKSGGEWSGGDCPGGEKSRGERSWGVKSLGVSGLGGTVLRVKSLGANSPEVNIWGQMAMRANGPGGEKSGGELS